MGDLRELKELETTEAKEPVKINYKRQTVKRLRRKIHCKKANLFTQSPGIFALF